jgi:uridine kinase
MYDALGACSDRIDAMVPGHPTRVAIDGITGAGKTTFAGRLAAAFQERGRTVLHVSMDGFHHPRAVRYRQGRGSADGYYEDAYDFAAVRGVLLDPLGPDGDRRIRTAVIDLASDTPVDAPPLEVPDDAVLVVDGSFLQKPALRDAWDVVVYLRATFAAAAERGARRDAAALGGLDAARAAFRDRYHPAQRRYLAECDPDAAADLVVDVEDPAHPELVR